MTSGLSGSSLSAPEVEVLASVPGDTLSFIHLYVSVLDSVQVNQRQWAKPNSKVRVSLYNKSETHKIKAFFFFFYWRTNSEDTSIHQASIPKISEHKGLPIYGLIDKHDITSLWYFHTHCPWWLDSRPHDPAPLPGCDWTQGGHLTVVGQ